MVSIPARDTARTLSHEANYNGLPDESEFWGTVSDAFKKEHESLSVDQIEAAIHEAMKKIEVLEIFMGSGEGGIMTDKAMIDTKRVGFLIEKLDQMKQLILYPPRPKKAKKKPA